MDKNEAVEVVKAMRDYLREHDLEGERLTKDQAKAAAEAGAAVQREQRGHPGRGSRGACGGERRRDGSGKGEGNVGTEKQPVEKEAGLFDWLVERKLKSPEGKQKILQYWKGLDPDRQTEMASGLWKGMDSTARKRMMQQIMKSRGTRGQLAGKVLGGVGNWLRENAGVLTALAAPFLMRAGEVSGKSERGAGRKSNPLLRYL